MESLLKGIDQFWRSPMLWSSSNRFQSFSLQTNSLKSPQTSHWSAFSHQTNCSFINFNRRRCIDIRSAVRTSDGFASSSLFRAHFVNHLLPSRYKTWRQRRQKVYFLVRKNAKRDGILIEGEITPHSLPDNSKNILISIFLSPFSCDLHFQLKPTTWKHSDYDVN